MGMKLCGIKSHNIIKLATYIETTFKKSGLSKPLISCLMLCVYLSN
jgi:hypothetical protein